jgi:cyclopropane fatty-acyl-phospholipid synthase-like methyltransferase
MATDSIYRKENAALFEALYGKGLISLGGTQAIVKMFSGIAVHGKAALDIGYGLGGVADYLMEHYQMKVSGVEIHEWMQEYAQGHARGTFALYDDKGQIPFPPRSFDIVYSKGVFNHIHDKAPLLQQIKGILKDEGLLLVQDWIFPDAATQRGVLAQETEASYRKVLGESGFTDLDFRDDSDSFSLFVEHFLQNLETQKSFIQKQFGEEIFAVILQQHRDLLQAIENKYKMAVRILAR